MSIENEIKNLTAAVQALTSAMAAKQSLPSMASAPVVPEPVAAPPQFIPAAAPQFAPVAQMPAPPAFVAQVVPAVQLPFSDVTGLIQYATDSYYALGAEKGILIQKVLTDLKYGAFTEVRPEHFATIYQAVEALKA